MILILLLLQQQFIVIIISLIIDKIIKINILTSVVIILVQYSFICQLQKMKS